MMTLTEESTDTQLVLDSLEIKKYRGFQHLQIPRLGRVNLITGRNNAGKSSLLEAILLYTRLGSPEAFWQIFRSRAQIKSASSASNSEDVAALIASVLSTFYAASLITKLDSKQRTIFFEISPNSNTRLQVQLYLPQDAQLSSPDSEKTSELALAIRFPRHSVLYDAVRILEPHNHIFFEQETAISTQFLTVYGLGRTQVGELWDKISLTKSKKDAVINALRLIEPRCIDLNLRGDAGVGLGRVPYVLLESQDEPISLSLLGDGMSRLFGLALALVNAQNGVLLIDEVETGLHYSVLTDMWRLIFQLAHQLNTQIFATTHSWECIEAFQKASEDDEQDDGVLIRLANKQGDVQATVFDERRLAIVTREQIEVR